MEIERMATRRITVTLFFMTWSAIMAIAFPWHCKAQDSDSITFHENYNEALREAKQTRKPIFLEFRCAP
jgi:hypothetical protein